jgi:hypothetical protein
MGRAEPKPRPLAVVSALTRDRHGRLRLALQPPKHSLEHLGVHLEVVGIVAEHLEGGASVFVVVDFREA